MTTIAIAVVGFGVNDVEGQTRATLSAGPAQYDLSGTGWSGVAELHVERDLGRLFRMEVGTGVFWYTTQGDDRVVMLLPEVGIALQAPAPLPLFLGAGIGRSLVVSGVQSDELTLFAALGLSFETPGGWFLRPEMRLRSIDPWVGAVAGYTLGISKPIG